MLLLRYADDIVVCFQYQDDAERFQREMTNRLSRFHLDLNTEKTRLIEFGRFAAQDRRRRGQCKPATFDFLGFTHVCGTTRKGEFTVKRLTARKKLLAKLQDLKRELRRRLHDSIREVGKWLGRVLAGHYQYYAVPGNSERLEDFRYHVTCLWKRAIARRSQKGKCTWERIDALAVRFLPRPRILHPYPNKRYGLRV